MSKSSQFRIKAPQLLPLSQRKNAPGVRRAVGHFGAIGLTAAAVWMTHGTIWSFLLVPLLGYFVAFLFTTEHEMAHQTAFRTRLLNYIAGHFAGLVIVLPYEYYRVFHWDHHRFTQDLDKDPELSSPLPTTRLGLTWYWTGIPTWIGRIRMLIVHGVLGQVTERWVPEDKRPLIVREARLYLLAYLSVIGASVWFQSAAALWLWILPVVLGQWVLRPYLLSEHTGCEHSPNMLANTRTTYTNWFVRFFAWNMPYHVEHHAYPSVPFHALPKLNKMLAGHITNTEDSYRASTAAVLRYVGSEEHHADVILRTLPTSP